MMSIVDHAYFGRSTDLTNCAIDKVTRQYTAKIDFSQPRELFHSRRLNLYISANYLPVEVFHLSCEILK